MLLFSPSISLGEFRPFCWKSRVILVHFFRIIPLLCLEKLPFFPSHIQGHWSMKPAGLLELNQQPEKQSSLWDLLFSFPQTYPQPLFLCILLIHTDKHIPTHTHTWWNTLDTVSHTFKQKNIHKFKTHTSLAKLSLFCDRNWLVNKKRTLPESHPLPCTG